MEGLSVGGLASGLDTNAIIDGLTNLEMAKVKREDAKLQEYENKKSAYNELFERISTFQSKADSIDEIKSFNLFTAKSNDDTLATISGGEDAIPGTYEVEVGSLATTQKVASGSFSTMNTTLSISGSFELTKSSAAIKADPSATKVTIDISATDSLKDIASKINSSDGVGVSASILTLASGDYRLILTSVDEGSDNFYMNETAGSPLGASGLGFISDTQKTRMEQNFTLLAGGPATASSKLNALSTGIGANNLTSGDKIQITGTDAQGNTITPADFTIDLTPGSESTIQDLLTSIEAAYGNVTASINDSGEVVLTDTSGGTSEITLNLALSDTDSSGSTLRMGSSKSANSFTNVLSEGKKAFIKIDGLAVSMQTNSDDKVLTGTTLNLKKAEPGTVVKLELNRDLEGVKGKVKEFIDEYNALLKFIDEKTKVEVKDEKSSDSNSSSSKSKVKKGDLAGDSTVRRIRNEIQSIMTNQIEELNGATNYNSLASIGITSNKTTGALEIDDDDLNKALKADFEGVRRLFVSSGYSNNGEYELGRYTNDTETGTYEISADTDEMDTDKTSGSSLSLANRVGDILSSNSGHSKGLSIKAPSGSGTGTFTFVRGLAGMVKRYYDNSNDYVDGLFKVTRDTLDKRINSSEKRISDMEDRVASFKQGLVKRFSDLELAMSRLQSQSASFQSQIGSMRR